MTTGPRFLDEDNPMVGLTADAPATLGRPVLLDEEPDAPARLPDIGLPPPPRVPEARGGTGLLVVYGLGGLILSWALFSAVGFVLMQYEVSPLLGIASGSCVAASLLLIFWAIAIEVRAWRELASVDRLRRVLSAGLAERDATLSAGLEWLALVRLRLPDAGQIEAALRAASSAGEVRALLRNRIADPLEARALQLGQRGAAECAALIAISPHGSWDGLIVTLRGLRLIRQIASLYGVRPGIAVTVSMLRNVAWTAVGTAGMVMMTENVAAWAVTEAPFIKNVAGILGAGAFEAVRIIRLARFTARSCCPLIAL